MSKTSGKFFEEHIEKIVLAIVGLVCVLFLIFRVLVSPVNVVYDGRKFGPDNIDAYISKQAELLKEGLDSKPASKKLYEPNLGHFDVIRDSPLRNIRVDLYPPQPVKLKKISKGEVYSVPVISKIGQTSVEHIRAVAYIPTKTINEVNAYDSANSESNDIDFVTVEAKVDIAQLVKSFYECFAGEAVNEQWRDPCLANPVFAAVEMERQELLVEHGPDKKEITADGNWSNWQIVPRTKIDHQRKTLEVIEEIGKLPPGGLYARLYQFKDPEVTMDLLQPEAYRIASAEEEWLPPSLHKEYVKYQEELKLQEKRQAREIEKQKTEESREKARAEREKARTEREKTLPEQGGGAYETRTPSKGAANEYVVIESLVGRRTPPKKDSEGKISEQVDTGRPKKSIELPEKGKETQQTKSIKDFYDKLDKILIAKQTDITKASEPIVFWAHDDTVEPGKSYRYRMRIGVFNPIAGTDKFVEQDRQFRNKVILWSDFSEATETVRIPEKLYFFPLDIREAAKSVTVQVYKYVLGHWYGQKFTVKPGEIIGKVAGPEITPQKKENPEQEEENKVATPQTIDYSVGAVFVDYARVKDWSGGKNLHERAYFDMLYSFDGTYIEHIAIERSYWPEELLLKFNDLQNAEKKPQLPLRAWGSKIGLSGKGGAPGKRSDEQ